MVARRTIKLFVEGGGDEHALREECRKGFRNFLENSGAFEGRCKPKIVACGSREDAYKDFCTALRNGERAFLLVDSEDPVSAACSQGHISQWKPWQHLQSRDSWQMPQDAAEEDCHLMAQCMETWFLADMRTLKDFWKKKFTAVALPAAPLEDIVKKTVYQLLSNATQGQYSKGAHSFKILERINPAEVMATCPWARRLVEVLKRKLPKMRH